MESRYITIWTNKSKGGVDKQHFELHNLRDEAEKQYKHKLGLKTITSASFGKIYIPLEVKE